MPRFKILPTDQSSLSAEITTLDAGSVLHIVQRMQSREADVLVDDAYSFTVRLNESGMWTIFQRDHQLHAATQHSI